ncbi:MAG: MFS transporter [Actinomycetota bacterium]|nr:MFS transporter [Actinomycetota bacterium]
MSPRKVDWRARLAASALGEPAYRRLFAGQALSVLGDALVPVALAFTVLALTGSPTDVGLVLAAQTVPLVVLLLFGGVWADRLPRQRVMLSADVIRCAAQGTVAALVFLDEARVWQLAVLQAVYGAATAFFNPAATGLIPETVSPERLQSANALLALARSSANVVGPIIAGALLAVGGGGWAFAADAATFAVSALALARLRPQIARVVGLRKPLVAELREGWHEFSRHTWLWLSVAFFAVYFTVVLGPYFVLGPVVSQRELGGPSAWAAIVAAAGVGNVIGSVISLRVRPARPLLTSYVVSFATVPVLALLAVAAPLPAIVLASLVGRIGMAFFGTIWYTTLQENVPAHALSRVSAYDWLGSTLFFPLGLVLAGPVAAQIGVSATLLGSAVVFAGLICAMLAVDSIRTVGARANPGPAAL